ncbi:probable methylcrotonoyl-CoA carboxylase beta chain, mitochondrial [Watersipora subatra]|uniref:probable methylcrotonoyl-CoA carboxylase beta chain, mitochondrial n=1 Tax=Watersipora subatra TaxID=2589382 RepID=UPI00355AEA30
MALKPAMVRRIFTGVRYAILQSSACHGSTAAKTFTAISDTTDKSSENFKNLFSTSKGKEQEYQKLLEVVRQSDPKGVQRHLKQGKLLVRDRMSKLLDNVDDFLELSAVAGVGMPYGDIPSAGVVTGFGQVHGKDVLVIANDGSFKGGTVFPITLKKQLRAQQIAQELSIPCVYIVDSGGAFLPLQSEIFINGGITFYNEAVMSSMGIPQIAVVCGMCTAGGAYIPTMADEAIMVHKTGSIFLAGPPLVKAALGEIISAEELGGATMHSTVSGCVDHFARDEEESYRICRDVILSLNLPDVVYPQTFCPPLYDAEDLHGLVSACDPNAHQVISRIVDGSGFQEFKALYGKALVTGFASISGYPVGIVANAAAEWNADASTKASHFVQLCTQRRLPLIFLVNQHERDRHPDPLVNGEEMKCHARFMASVACSDVLKVSIVTGAFHGLDSYAMGSKALGSNLVFHWPSASFSMHSPDHLQSVSSMTEEEVGKKSSSLYAAANVWTDGMILPQQTRQVLSKVLQLFKYSKEMKLLAHESTTAKQTNFRM